MAGLTFDKIRAIGMYLDSYTSHFVSSHLFISALWPFKHLGNNSFYVWFWTQQQTCSVGKRKSCPCGILTNQLGSLPNLSPGHGALAWGSGSGMKGILWLALGCKRGLLRVACLGFCFPIFLVNFTPPQSICDLIIVLSFKWCHITTI